MKNFWFSPVVLSAGQKKELHEKLFAENVFRCRLFAQIVLLFEVILIVFTGFVKAGQPIGSFLFDPYVLLYSLLIGLSSVMLWFLRVFSKKSKLTNWQQKLFKSGLAFFVGLFLLWGTAVTLIDQQHYGHTTAFLVNLICVSVLFHSSNKRILLLYSVPVLSLYILLPFFQLSQAVLMGHYINLTVLLFFCWLASRMLYSSVCKNFYQQQQLKQVNEQLTNQIKENQTVAEQLEQTNQKLHTLMITDELTGIFNRRGFVSFLKETMERSPGSRRVSFIMMDIDAFKAYNDFYGHLNGDEVIRQVAKAIQSEAASNGGLAARYGGEEFIAVLFDQESGEAGQAAERIRHAVANLRIAHSYSPVFDFVTISAGVKTGTVDEGDSFLLQLADQALYRSKQSGRNRVAVL